MSQKMNYQEELSKCKTMEDITGPGGLVQKIIKDAVEQVLGNELTNYVAKQKEEGGTASRNGTSHKTLKTAYGNIGIEVPRLRESGFEPDIINITYTWTEFLDLLYEKDWCPFIKETFNGFGNTIEYLGRYTHKIAISLMSKLYIQRYSNRFSAKSL